MDRRFLVFSNIFAVICCVACMSERTGSDIASEQDEKALKNHRLDSLNLFMFVALLILTILTIWLFKHVRFRFVHETGLGIIYGLIIGAVIRYTGVGNPKNHEVVSLPTNSAYSRQPPDSLQLRIISEDLVTNTSRPLYFEYDYRGPIKRIAVDSNVELDEKATFDPEVFFNVLLPPIIFYAGYSMKRRHFFRNFGAIVAFAFLGTAVSCFVVGAIVFGITRLMPYLGLSFNDCLFFGALISATDPVTILAIFHDLNVDVDLYAMVFGESVLNDAVAIVLAQAIDKYSKATASAGFDVRGVFEALGNFLGVFCGAFAIGAIMGCITALMTKFTKIRDYPLLETALFFLMSYSTFQAAEAADMTGIVAVLFCGITQAHYTYNNLSPESKSRTKELFELLNFCAENLVFVYIGVSTFTFRKHVWNAGYIFIAFLAILIARACNIYPLSALLNLGRRNKIKLKHQHMMMFSGLRGAIAFALAIRNTSSEQRRLLLSSTLVIVMTTVILCGGLTTTMLNWLDIRVGVEDETETQNFEAVRSHSPGISPVSTEPTIPKYEKAWFVSKWSSFDHKYMKPLLTHAQPLLEETLPQCCAPLARLLTTNEQLQLVNLVEDRPRSDSDTDLIIAESELGLGDHSNNTAERVQPSGRITSEQSVEDDGDLSLGSQTALPTRVKIPGSNGEHV